MEILTIGYSWRFSPEFRLEIDKMFLHFVTYIIEYDIDQAQSLNTIKD